MRMRTGILAGAAICLAGIAAGPAAAQSLQPRIAFPDTAAQQAFGKAGVSVQVAFDVACPGTQGGLPASVRVSVDGEAILATQPSISYGTWQCGQRGWLWTFYVGLYTLPFGSHSIVVDYPGTAVASPASASFDLNVPASFSGSAGNGDGLVKASIADPRYDGVSGECEAVDVRTGVAGGPGMPPDLPAGFDAPAGLVRIDAHRCSWFVAGSGAAGALVRRVLLEWDRDLPAGTTAWSYGPVRNVDAVPRWHERAATITGKRAMFDLDDAGADVSQQPPADLYEMGATIALAVPRGAFTQSSVTQMWWGGPEQNGWGMSLTRHGEVLVAVLYIYDAAGDPRWVIMPGGQWNAQKTAFTGDLYRPRGAPYSRIESGASFIAGEPVGSATLTLNGTDRMVLDTRLDAVSQSRSLQRQVFGVPSALLAVPVSDQWWGGARENGWGIALAQQYRNLFAVWFTYDASGAPLWLVAPSGRLQDFGGLPIVRGTPLYRTRGAAWNGSDYDPARLTVTEVGSMDIYFSSSASGRATFTGEGIGASLPVARLPF